MQTLFKVIDTNKNNLDVTNNLIQIALECGFINPAPVRWFINNHGELAIISLTKGYACPPENYKVIFNKEYFTELENDQI